jgi:multiple sugar transport system substrate-binding protein
MKGRESNMRKWIAAATLPVAIMAIVAGCGSSGSSGSGGTVNSVVQSQQQGAIGQNLDLSKLSPGIPDPSSPVTITFQSWVGSTDGAKMWQKLADQFHQIHPNITIKFQDVPSEEAVTKLTTQIAGGNPPDVAYVDTSAVGSLAPRGALTNLEDYIANSKGVTKSDYVPAFASMSSYNGQMYGLPIDGESTALFYRTDLFQQAGISGPPKTWADMQADAQKLTDPSKKQYGIAMFASQYETGYYWTPFLYQAGGTQTSSDGKTATFASPEGVKAAEFYTGLAKYSPPDLWSSNSWDGRVTFAQGKVGMYMAGSWFASEMQNSFPKTKGKWAVTPLPTMDAGSPCATTIAGDVLVIPAGSSNHDAAWKWIEFVSAPQNMALIDLGTKAKPAGLLPPRQSLLNDPHVFDTNPVLRGFADNMKCGITNLSQSKHWGDVDGGPLTDALAAAIYGKKPAAQALTDAAQKANDILAKP